MWYDVKGRIILKSIKDEEAKSKILKIRAKAIGPNKVPYLVTHDGRTIRYPHPEINIGDSIKYDFNNKKIIDFAKFDVGQSVFCTGGNNIGRIGTI